MAFTFNHGLEYKQKISQRNAQMSEARVMLEETEVGQRPFVITVMWRLIHRQRLGG